ncbi:MAG TPA: DUF6443 domain-containing protein, partial [Cyclobacteriaceae bacterium]|nr:DUF6443 domain-containing protein [Cyclobacteriaceae bacterium]
MVVKRNRIGFSQMIQVYGLVLFLFSITYESYGQCSTVSVSPANAVTCNGASATFTASGGSNYRWYEDSPIPANLLQSGVNSFTPPSTGSYFLVGANSCSQDQTVPFSIVISTTPATPTITDVTIPYNSAVVLKPNQSLSSGESFKFYASNQTTLLHQGSEFYTGNLTAASTSYYVSKTNGYCESTKSLFRVYTDALPSVDAGYPVTVNLPASSVVLTGSGSDGGASVAFLWTKLSGPSVTTDNEETNELTLTNLSAGTYVFRLAVTDNIGQKVVDDVVVQANASGSSNNYNYTRQEDILVKGITSQSQASTLPAGQKVSSTTYMDELGKPMESVEWQGSPTQKDIITPVVYDQLGRNAKSYLHTVTSAQGDGTYKKVLDASGEYSGSQIQNLYTDKPYAVTKFDNTPLSRAIEQGSVGAGYQPGSTSGTAKVTYGTNGASEVRIWTINTGSVLTGLPESSSAWAVNKLILKTSTYGVNDLGKQTVAQVFEDVQGLKLLERQKIDASNWAETYYVYDNRNNLRFIIPPQLSKDLKTAGNYNITLDQVNRFCFQSIYDDQHRMVASKGPGTDWNYAVYDIRNRVVLTQDGNQRLKNEWTYFEYDDFDRQTATGIFRPTSSNYTREYYQSVCDGTVTLPPTTATVLTGTDIVSSSKGSYQEFIASNSITLQPGFTATGSSGTFKAWIYPIVQPGEALTLGTKEPLAYTYYDDYTGNSFFQDVNFQFTAENWTTTTGAEPFEKFDRVRGKVTGTSVKVLNTSQWLNSVIYYDKYQTPIQVISTVHTGGVNRNSTLHDFAEKILETKYTQSSQTISRTFDYDHAGRVLKLYHRINDQPKVLLSAMVYDELGQLVDKKLHSMDEGSNYLQSIDYKYNIKGWLTAINSTSGTDAGDPTDYFAMEFAHESNTFNSSNVVRKDGYITAAKWRQDLNSNNQKLYNYDYDNLDRFYNANFKSGNGATWTSQVDYYSEKAVEYDLNGNITKLKRYNNEVTSAGLIDDLTYNYGSGGNQLMYVSDNGTASIKEKGFNDGNTSGNDYTYDVNGNMTLDKNKNMSITYNHLNLPDRITLADNSYIQYIYDAGGNKLSQVFYNAATQTTITADYSGEFVYLDGIPAMIHHEEGRLVPPSFTNLIKNREANSLEGYTASQNVTLTTATQNGQNYVKAVCNQSTSTPGIWPIGGAVNVKAGEKYSFKVLGYRETSHNANLYVWGNAGDIVWTGPLLPEGLSNETWVTTEFAIPANVTQIKVGVLWSAPASGATFYINQVALYKLDWEYQYFISDHQGSPRVVLQTAPATISLTATMESENQNDENGKFLNINASYIETNPVANATPGGNEVIRMNSAYNIGPARSLKVYPGDLIDAQVSAYYPTASGLTQASRTTMAATLIDLMSGGSQAIIDGINTAYNTTGNPDIVLAPDQGSTKPSAFLNYILFDEGYHVLEAKSAALGSANTLHVIPMPQVNVKEAGILFIYLSYDNNNTNPVYFDELKITHQESPMIQVNAYYPYGMTAYSWIREGEEENKYLYQGKELITQTGWQDFHARHYDPV